MKKWLIATCACAMVIGATATDVKIATREWVAKQFAASGIRISLATVTTNVVTQGGETTTNLTFTSPFQTADNTNCVAVSLTFSQPAPVRTAATALRTSLRSLFAAYAAADDLEIRMTLRSGTWYDRRGRPTDFVISGGKTFTMPDYKMPEPPPAAHTCEFDANCFCIDAGKTEDDVEIPEEYQPLGIETMRAMLQDWWLWIDYSTWTDFQTVDGEQIPVLFDDNRHPFRLSELAKTDAWQDAASDAIEIYDDYLRDCRSDYRKAHVCDKQNPQHAWENHTCGQYTWKVCQRNAAHNEGTERHEYANGNAGASGHYCKCGNGPMQEHTFATGERTQTADGWTAVRYCTVPGCGYVDEEAITHTHHHVNCQPCDVDGCNEPCSCGGNHVWGEATQNKCATCVCDGSESCNAKPPASDITLHSGWMPCGQTEDPLEDNADGKAAGAHCQCQCFTFGHDARTQHLYAEQEDGTCVYYDEEQHRRLSGNGNGICSRCGQRRGTLEPHQEDPEKVTYTYKAVSGGGSVCERKTKCIGKGCGHEFKEDVEHSPDSNTETYISIPPSTCRHKVQCANCKGWITEDGSHERDASNGCKCSHGCGYQFAHVYPQSANTCGFYVCQYCGEEDTTRQGVHIGWTESGDGHVCACGRKYEPHDYATREYKGKGGVGYRTYTYTCKCGKSYEANEPCVHVWPATPNSTTVDGDELVHTYICCYCDATKEEREAIPPPEGCVGSSHVANTNGMCGCVCGYYPNTEAGGEEWHRWDETVDGRDNQKCTCKCGRYHKAREWSTYEKNRGDACEGVCAYCRTYAAEADGLVSQLSAAGEEAHTELTSAGAAQRRHCGCRCGLLDQGAESERFHIQMTGSCRCWGDGNGGQWHFPCPKSGCTAICQYKSDGEEHLAAPSKQRIETTLAAASPEDHYKSSSTCGCLCGEYTSANIDAWNGVDFHSFASEQACECFCRNKTRHDYSVGPVQTGVKPGWIIKKWECSRCGELDDTEILEECQHGEWEEVSRVQVAVGVYSVTRRCKVCGFTETTTEDENGGNMCTLNAHIAKSDGTCGCLCGHVLESDGQFHRYANDNACVCKCGKYHRVRQWSAGAISSGTACLDVCPVCKTRKRMDSPTSNPNLTAKDTDHTGTAEGTPKPWCGCRCHTVNPNESVDSRFHPKHPDTCRCYGDGTGNGAWHFPSRDPKCRKLCKHKIDGKRHLAVDSKTRQPTLESAEPKDHTPKTSGTCGCMCGDVTPTSDEINAKVGDAYHFHRWDAGRCICVCGMCPQHKAVANPGCMNICKAFSTDSYAKRANRQGKYYCPGKAEIGNAVMGDVPASSLKKLHTSVTNGCGCVCKSTSLGGGTGSAYNALDDSAYHNPANLSSCWCTCGKEKGYAWHVFREGNDCANICNDCKATSSRGKVAKAKVNTAKQTEHTAVTNRCGCACGDAKSMNYPKFHPWKNGNGCRCIGWTKNGGNGHRTQQHGTITTEKTGESTRVCQTCGNTIGVTTYVDHCANEANGGCFYYPHAYKTEEGHAENCGEAGQDDSENDDDKADDPTPEDDEHTCHVCGAQLDEETNRCPNADDGEHQKVINGNETDENGGTETGGGSSGGTFIEL